MSMTGATGTNMGKLMRVVTLELTVTVPAEVSDDAIVAAVNEALEEPPNYWGTWLVSTSQVTGQKIVAWGDIPEGFDE